MYEYKFSDKQSDEISDKTAKIDDLFKKFDDIDSKFDFKQEQTSDGKLSLARKEFERPTDEQIKESAENSLFDFKDSSLKKIENDLHKNEFWINIKYYDGSPAIVCEMSEKIYNSEGNTITFSQKEKIIEEACIDEISTSLRKKYRKFFRGNVFVTKSRGGRGE